jgi:enoyl-[acyl-carrier-protein] reductase (NADH)
LLKRLPLFEDVANAAATAVSDYSRAITAAIINLTCGEITD